MNFTVDELISRWDNNTQILCMQGDIFYQQFTGERSAKLKLNVKIDKNTFNIIVNKLNLKMTTNAWFKDTYVWRKEV